MKEVGGMMHTSKEDGLLNFLDNSDNFDAVVVEGYDGVGKGRILSILSEYYGVTPYRPDYNLWQKYDHRKKDRWKVSGFFWDVFSHFNHHSGTMLFDRGVISGAVYNDDESIAKDYKKLLRDMRVLHILVYCNEEDYKKFQISRGSVFTEDSWENCVEYTKRYRKFLSLANVEYIIYRNEYDENKSMESTCGGCGHYAYGWCRHPVMNCEVNSTSLRCSYSRDKEVQDNYDNEMHCV